ncbi:MAG TPA: flagellar export chaperone FliS [Terriglobales bacterium]|nr:flagellar export chaperone FliS [Terriglobales bacterium]
MNPLECYRQAEAQGENPVQLVVLLYQQLIKDLRAAIEAMQESQVERRTAEMDHALVVLAQLQGTLNKEKGGEVAANLSRFYDLLRASIIEAQCSGNSRILKDQVANLLTLHEAWTEVAKSQARPPAAPAPAPNETDLQHRVRGDWKV